MKENINIKKLIIIVLALILIIIFSIFVYKKIKSGNNKSNKSALEIQEYILNLNSYDAEIEVSVNSNKNKNKYLIRQEFKRDRYAKQTVLKPENIEGMEFEFKDNSLTLNNSRLNISKIYSDYPYIADNVLWLDSFGKKYAESEKSRLYEENDFVVMEVKTNDNKYLVTRKLYLEKGTGTPNKMEIIDDNNNSIIYISYKEISINQ